MSVKVKDIVYLKLTRKLNNSYRLPFTSTLNIIKAGPFRVIERVSKVTFYLYLLDYIYIYPVILVIYLKSTLLDIYNYTPIIVRPIINISNDDTNTIT